MKLKFTDEVMQLITELCMLPDTLPPTDTSARAVLTRLKKTMPRPVRCKATEKIHFRIDCNINFLYAMCSLKEGETNDKNLQYSNWITAIKSIPSGEILKNNPLVKLGVHHGVIYLSDIEIKHLIEHNRIKNTP